jgi:hypothetical protein
VADWRLGEASKQAKAKQAKAKQSKAKQGYLFVVFNPCFQCVWKDT